MAKKLSYEFVKKSFEDRGFTLLSKEYKNNFSKLDVICPKGHNYSITWDVFRSSKVGCGQCWGNRKLYIDDIREEFQKEGYKLLTKEIINSKQRLSFVCPNGHSYSISWNKFQQGKRCGKCKRNGGYTNKEVEKLLAEKGFLLLDQYKHGKKRIKVSCSKGHTFYLLFNSFNSRGVGCPHCFIFGVSKAEKSIYQHLRQLGFAIERNTRKIIPPYELDIFIPQKNLAIEYCGLYWHSEISGGKDRKYHYTKRKLCEEKGIRLITIFEDEFLNRPKVVLSRIKNSLGATKKVIYGRNTTVEEIDNNIARNFLNKEHLQGYSRSKKSWALFDNSGILVAVSTVSSITRSHASENGTLLELNRMCFLSGYSVVGGASKMFKKIVEFAQQNGYRGIKSYQDMRYGDPFNPVYEKLEFNLERETKYTPHYIDKNYTERYRNQSLRKTPEERLTGKTEWQLRQEQGYDRIWDCGHRTYVFYF